MFAGSRCLAFFVVKSYKKKIPISVCRLFPDNFILEFRVNTLSFSSSVQVEKIFLDARKPVTTTLLNYFCSKSERFSLNLKKLSS